MKELETTKLGYDPFECVSTIQKAIRRGDEELAMYFALEMERSGYWSWVRNRLRIVAYEDVGIADPQSALLAVLAVRDADEMRKNKGDSWRLALSVAVLALARSEKSRIADHFQAAVRDDLETAPPKQIPDYALDKHTIRGKKLGRGLEHFLAIGGKLENEVDVSDRYKEKAAQFWKKENVNGKKPESKAKKDPGQSKLF